MSRRACENCNGEWNCSLFENRWLCYVCFDRAYINREEDRYRGLPTEPDEIIGYFNYDDPLEGFDKAIAKLSLSAEGE